jgi:hypothetical protein
MENETIFHICRLIKGKGAMATAYQKTGEGRIGVERQSFV